MQIVPGLPLLIGTYRGTRSLNHVTFQHGRLGIDSVYRLGIFIAKRIGALDRAVFFSAKQLPFWPISRDFVPDV